MVGLRNIEELESEEPIVQDSEEELHWLNSSPLRHWLNSSPSQHTYSPRLFLNENRSEEENPNEDFGLGCSEAAAKNIDEVEAVGNIGSERTGDDCVMADQLNFECLGKKKTKEKNPVEVGRNKKTNGIRIAIPLALEDILQTKGIRSQDAAKHLKVSMAKLKSSCRKYGIHRWPPCNEHKFIKQSLPNETPAVVGQEGIPQLSSHTVPSTRALTATVDTNSFFEKKILSPQFLPTAQQESPNAGLGNKRIKFLLSWPWKMVELEQQAEKRLPLEAGTYYIKYKDEDDGLTFIACDEDLGDFIYSSSLLGTHSIEIFLEPKVAHWFHVDQH